MTSPPQVPEAPPAHDPTLKVGLIVVAGVAILGLALMVGAGIGRRRAAQEASQDPIAALELERETIEGEAAKLAPPLHGRGAQPAAAEVAAVEARLSDLVERARQVNLPLDTIQIEAALARARFEALLDKGDSDSFDEATLLLRKVGHRGEEPVLRARLQLARGEEPDVSWLASWTDVEDEAVAEAARLLCASLYAAKDPTKARRLVSTRVDERLAKGVLARIELASAARALDPNAVNLQVSVGGAEVAEVPRLRREIARVGLREGTAALPSFQTVERTLRVVGFLRGDIGSDGERLARVAFVVARRALVEVAPVGDSEPEEGRARRLEVLKSFLDAVSKCGLRAGPSFEVGIFLDDLLSSRGPPEPEVRILGALAAARLDARFYPVHLEALTPHRAALSESPEPLLRALALRMGEEAPQPSALQPFKGFLPDAQRAQLLLAAQQSVPAGPDRLGLCQEALRLDPTSPNALLATWEGQSEALPADALARLLPVLRQAIKERPLLRPEARSLLRRLARLQEGWGQPSAAKATLAEAEESFGE